MLASPRSVVRRLALLQAAYYLVTGIWPLLHIRSFEAITGPKVDRWLVRTVGALVAVTGAILALAVRRGRVTEDAALVAAGNAVVLTAVDVVGVASRRISPVYLLDALLETPLALGWLWAWRNGALARSGDDRDSSS